MPIKNDDTNMKKFNYTKKLFTRFSRTEGSSMLELMVVVSLMAAASLVSVKLMESQQKGQKTITIKSEMQNLQFRVRSMLRTSEGCMDTLDGSGITTTATFKENATTADCIENGAILSNGFKMGNRSIPIGKEWGAGSGVKVTLGEARVIFNGQLSESDKDVYGTICYQLITKGLREGAAFGSTYTSTSPPADPQNPVSPPGPQSPGDPNQNVNNDADKNFQIFRWYQEDILVKNVNNDDPTKITNCNSDISDFSAANCESLGGYFVEETQECKSINVKPVQDNEVDNGPPPPGNYAISALGDLSSIGHGSFCGDVHIGTKDAESLSYSNLVTACDNQANGTSGNLYVGKNITTEGNLFANFGQFPEGVQVGLSGSGEAIIDGPLTVIDSLTAVPGMLQANGNLIVNNAPQVNESLSVGKSLKVEGEGDIDNVIINQNSISSKNGLEFYSNNNGDHTFYSKLKAIGDDSQFDTGAPDYLATMTYVNRLMLSKMTDEDRQKLFQELLNAAEETGIDILREDFLNRITVRSPDQSYSNGCVTPTYTINSVEVVKEPGAVYVDVKCGPVTPPPGTPYDCKWYREESEVKQSCLLNMSMQYVCNDLTKDAYLICPTGYRVNSGGCDSDNDDYINTASRPVYGNQKMAQGSAYFCKDSDCGTYVSSSSSCGDSNGTHNCTAWKCSFKDFDNSAPNNGRLPLTLNKFTWEATANINVNALCCKIQD